MSNRFRCIGALLASLLAGAPVRAAEQIQFQIDGLTVPVDLRELEAWSRDPGRTNGDLGVWFSLLDPLDRRALARLLQAPLLALFGSLQPQDYVRRNLEAIGAAKERAMHNLQRCVVANTDDMHASSQLVAHHFPWLGRALAADSVPHANTRDVQRHPSVVLPNGKWSHRDCQWHFNLKDHDGALAPPSH